MHRGLLDVPGNARHKGVPVFKVCVKISLWVRQRDGDQNTAGCLLTWYNLTWDALVKSRISRAPGAWEELVNYLGCCTSRSEVVSYIDTP